VVVNAAGVVVVGSVVAGASACEVSTGDESGVSSIVSGTDTADSLRTPDEPPLHALRTSNPTTTGDHRMAVIVGDTPGWLVPNAPQLPGGC
jgi:hypothetical protein